MSSLLPSAHVRSLTGLIATIAAATAFALPVAVPAADAIPSGTTIVGTMQTQLDTAKTQIGQGFSMTVTRPYPNGDPSYAGAIIRGHVADVRKASQGRKAMLTLAFDSIVLPTGESSPLSAQTLRVDTKKQSAVVQQAAGAGIGMVLGNIIGKKIGFNGGGALGAAAGFVAGNNAKTNFTVPLNAAISIQTTTETQRPQARQ